MPALRKLLIQLLTELEHSGMGRNKEQSSRLLGRLVSSAPRLIRPYMEPILKSKLHCFWHFKKKQDLMKICFQFWSQN